MQKSRTRRWKGPRRRMTLRLTLARQSDLKAWRSSLRHAMREASGKSQLPRLDENAALSDLIELGGCLARGEVGPVEIPAVQRAARRPPAPETQVSRDLELSEDEIRLLAELFGPD